MRLKNDMEAPSLLELLDLRGDTAAYMPLLHSTEPDKFSPEIYRILREDWVLSRSILILDQLEILPDFRRQQLGLRYIGTAIRQFGSGCRIVAIRPYPLQFVPELSESDPEWYVRMNMNARTDDASVATIKLMRYYESNGFVPVKGTDLMILDTCLAKAFSIVRSPTDL